MPPKSLRSAIEKLFKAKNDNPFSRGLPEGSGLNSAEDVRAVRWAIEELAKKDPKQVAAKASEVIGLFQEVGSNQEPTRDELLEELAEANPGEPRAKLAEVVDPFEPDDQAESLRQIIQDELLEPLLKLEDRFASAVRPAATPSEDDDDTDDLYWVKQTDLFMLKQIAYFSKDSALQRIIMRARAGFESGSFMWTVILDAYAHGHPRHKELFAALASPLPNDFIATCLLDSANAALIEGAEFPHPFDSTEGWAQVRKWLRNLNPDQFSYAHSATAALPFLSEPARTELLELALDHPSEDVSVEAAWAAARIGSARGVRELAKYATRVNTAIVAIQYLEELGREDAIPQEASDPDFRAKAAIVNWLSHPNEFGEPPESIDLMDTRHLFWPPTKDLRQVWLFKYRYPKTEKREEEDIGLGMVGSVTFALFGETTANLQAWDAYALHCCWELERNEDPRAPKKRTIAAGRELLSEHNDLSKD
ncbi:MAG TPA: hypothetical protein VF773_20260 [Verrucomicrobiae bacterium]